MNVPTHHTPHVPLRPSRLSALMSRPLATQSTKKSDKSIHTKSTEHKLLLRLQEAGDNAQHQLQALQNWLADNNYNINNNAATINKSLHSQFNEVDKGNDGDCEKRESKVCSGYSFVNEHRAGSTNNSVLTKQTISFFVECINKFYDKFDDHAIYSDAKTNNMT